MSLKEELRYENNNVIKEDDIAMTLTEKQIKRRMDEAFESHYMQYEIEAEWYGIEDSHVWVFDIPSKQITVMMELNEEAKRIKICEAQLEKQSDYRVVRETEWKIRGYYSW